jgi:hypothetical protein
MRRAQWHSGWGARGEGPDMSKFEIGLSKIESISKRLEMAMNSPRTAPCADRADSTIWGHGQEKRHRNIQEIVHICMSRQLTWSTPLDSLPRASFP